MKKQLLIVFALLLTAFVVTATVLNTGKKASAVKKENRAAVKTGCSAKKSHCPFSSVACY